MCLVLHSGNTYKRKLLLQLSDQQKIITQVTHHEVVQNRQRAFCQHPLPTLTFTVIGSGTHVLSFRKKGKKSLHVTFASGPTHSTHIKDLTAWNLKATLRISTCIYRAFLVVYRHNHLAAKRFPGREGGEGSSLRDIPCSRRRDQHPAGEQRRGLPRARAASERAVRVKHRQR